jgi:hypothetical protein
MRARQPPRAQPLPPLHPHAHLLSRGRSPDSDCRDDESRGAYPGSYHGYCLRPIQPHTKTSTIHDAGQAQRLRGSQRKRHRHIATFKSNQTRHDTTDQTRDEERI